MLLQVFPSTGGVADVDSIFIPQTDLVSGGLADVAELDTIEPEAVKRDKVLYAYLTVLTSHIAALAAEDKLGISVAVPNINAATHTFTLTLQRYLADNNDSRPLPLPVPTSGIYLGRGEINFTDIFPNAVKVAATTAITEAGFAVGVEPLIPYGCSAYADIDLAVDSRQLLYCLMKDFARDTTTLPTKATGVDSAVSARSVGTSSEVSIPATYIATVNPLTDLVADDSYITHILSSGNVSLTFATIKTLGGDGTQVWDLDTLAA